MSEFTVHILLYFIPLIIANVLHMIVVKNNLLGRLSIPISTQLFGKNKTLRGFVVLPVLSGFISWINSMLFGPFSHATFYDLLIGFGLGLAYMLAELPNSFIKRRLGIENGEQSKKHKYFQLLMDKCDSLFGTLLFYYLVFSIHFKSIVILFFVALIIHVSISFLLVRIKIKKSF